MLSDENCVRNTVNKAKQADAKGTFTGDCTEFSVEDYMQEAIEEARRAAIEGEIPIGCVLVSDGEIIARAHNMVEQEKNPCAHAELLALSSSKLKYRQNVDMYVTAEPCSMCAGAIVLSRIRRLYIGCPNPKAGACVSLYSITNDPRLNHSVEVHTGILEEECSRLLKDFFKEIRKNRKKKKLSNFS